MGGYGRGVGDGKVGGQLRKPGDHRVLLQRITSDVLRWPTASSTWIPSDEADVFEVTAPDHAPRIVKVEREGMWCVRREEVAFPVLRARGFDEFPEIEYSTQSLDVAEAPFTVMPKTEGRPWPELWAENPQLAVWVVERIGDFLSRLALVDWREVPGVVRPEARVRGAGHWFAAFFAPLLAEPTLSVADRNRIDELFEAMRHAPDAFGGWQFAQVITDGRRTFAAIDWGNLGAHWRLNDLAATICSLDRFGSDAAALLRGPLLDSFTKGSGLSPSDESLLRLWLDLWAYFGRAADLHRNV